MQWYCSTISALRAERLRAATPKRRRPVCGRQTWPTAVGAPQSTCGLLSEVRQFRRAHFPTGRKAAPNGCKCPSGQYLQVGPIFSSLASHLASQPAKERHQFAARAPNWPPPFGGSDSARASISAQIETEMLSLSLSLPLSLGTESPSASKATLLTGSRCCSAALCPSGFQLLLSPARQAGPRGRSLLSPRALGAQIPPTLRARNPGRPTAVPFPPPSLRLSLGATREQPQQQQQTLDTRTETGMQKSHQAHTRAHSGTCISPSPSDDIATQTRTTAPPAYVWLGPS